MKCPICNVDMLRTDRRYSIAGINASVPYFKYKCECNATITTSTNGIIFLFFIPTPPKNNKVLSLELKNRKFILYEKTLLYQTFGTPNKIIAQTDEFPIDVNGVLQIEHAIKKMLNLKAFL